MLDSFHALKSIFKKSLNKKLGHKFIHHPPTCFLPIFRCRSRVVFCFPSRWRRNKNGSHPPPKRPSSNLMDSLSAKRQAASSTWWLVFFRIYGGDRFEWMFHQQIDHIIANIDIDHRSQKKKLIGSLLSPLIGSFVWVLDSISLRAPRRELLWQRVSHSTYYGMEKYTLYTPKIWLP